MSAAINSLKEENEFLHTRLMSVEKLISEQPPEPEPPDELVGKRRSLQDRLLGRGRPAPGAKDSPNGPQDDSDNGGSLSSSDGSGSSNISNGSANGRDLPLMHLNGPLPRIPEAQVLGRDTLGTREQGEVALDTEQLQDALKSILRDVNRWVERFLTKAHNPLQELCFPKFQDSLERVAAHIILVQRLSNATRLPDLGAPVSKKDMMAALSTLAGSCKRTSQDELPLLR